MGKLLFIYNPLAGKGQIKYNLSDIVNIFTKGGYEVVAYPTQSSGDGYQKIVEDGENYDMICVSGGDGTLSEGVKAMMVLNKKIPLGYVPAGSTNDVAHSLGIPKNMCESAQGIMDGSYFDYDVGKFNQTEYFVYVAGFGAFTDVSYETSQSAKNILGHAAYIAEGLKRIPSIKGYNLTVEHDGVTLTGNFILGLISNATSVAGIKRLVADGVCFDDGLFEVTLVKTPSTMLELNSLLVETTLNKLSDKNFVTFKTSKLKITSEESLAWTLDGEAGGKYTQVEIENCKQAVRLRLKFGEFVAEQESINNSINNPEEMISKYGRTIAIEDQTDIEI